MSPSTIQNLPQTQTNLSNLTAPSSKKSGLVANWIKIDGKLVCQWLPAQ